MSQLYDFDLDLIYEKRCEQLAKNKIALWDVMQHCERPGSLDSAIVSGSIIPNAFNAFFNSHSNIRRVFFNGRKAEDTFRRKVLPDLKVDIKLIALPSTSPAHASLSFAQKLEAWKKLRK